LLQAWHNQDACCYALSIAHGAMLTSTVLARIIVLYSTPDRVR
jgi:hypothetical protein